VSSRGCKDNIRAVLREMFGRWMELALNHAQHSEGFILAINVKG